MKWGFLVQQEIDFSTCEIGVSKRETILTFSLRLSGIQLLVDETQAWHTTTVALLVWLEVCYLKQPEK